MEEFRSLAFAAAIGFQPGICSAEVVLSGRMHESAGLSSYDELDVALPFYRSFGSLMPYGMVSRSWVKSSSGNEKVGIHLQIGDVEQVAALTNDSGKSLDAAVTEFEAEILDIACDGSHDAFLRAGGSFAVSLSALKQTERSGSLSMGVAPVLLMSLEIENQSCEAH